MAGWLAAPAAGRPALGLAVDRLSGLFLVMALGAAVPVSVAFARLGGAGLDQRGRSEATRMLAQGYALALGAAVVIMTAQDAFTRCSAGRR